MTRSIIKKTKNLSVLAPFSINHPFNDSGPWNEVLEAYALINSYTAVDKTINLYFSLFSNFFSIKLECLLHIEKFN